MCQVLKGTGGSVPRGIPWFNWVENCTFYEPPGNPGGWLIFVRLAQNRIPFCSYSYHCGPDREILQSLGRDLEARAAFFSFAYWGDRGPRFQGEGLSGLGRLFSAVRRDDRR
jgi:hypothetical protein